MKAKKYWAFVVVSCFCGSLLSAGDNTVGTGRCGGLVRLMLRSSRWYENDLCRSMREQSLVGINAIGLVIHKTYYEIGRPADEPVKSVEIGSFKETVAEKLRQAGLIVLTDEQLLSEAGRPLLVLNMTTTGPHYRDYLTTDEGKVKGVNWGYDGHCSISLYQEQLLARNREITNYGITWNGKIKKSEWADSIVKLEKVMQEAAIGTLDEFVVAYTVANREEKPKQRH